MQVPQMGSLILCKDVPLDPTYQHTLWWSGAGEQLAYFQGKQKFRIDEVSYMRQEPNVILIELPADKIYDCNYLLFQNRTFSNRWWFAFITQVDYVNAETASITWEIDVMQNWYFDYELGDCYIEREHAAFDEIGDNIVPEGLDLGEYVLGAGGRPSKAKDGVGISILSNQTYVLATTTDGVTSTAIAGFYAGYPVSCRYITFDAGVGMPPSEFQAMLNQIVEEGKADGIVTVFMCPTEFKTANGGFAKQINFEFSKRDTDGIYGFEVKNKKLFTYPFNFLYVNNMQGQTGVFPYEFFDSDSCTFTMTANMNPNGEAIIWPLNYKGQFANYDERMSLQINPEISFAVDSYKTWVAQKGLSAMLGAVSGIAGGAISAAGAGGPVGLAAAGVGTGIGILNSLAAWREAYIQPPQTHGSIAGDSLQSAGLKDFFFYNKHITTDMAQRIDTFFTMFGYATKKVKKPNRTARTSFTYTQTIGCVATGSVPAQDMRRICQIYDSGITFWRNHDKVGDYSLSNTPTGREGG